MAIPANEQLRGAKGGSSPLLRGSIVAKVGASTKVEVLRPRAGRFGGRDGKARLVGEAGASEGKVGGATTGLR